MNRIKVLIVDDHTMVRTGLRQLLDEEEDIEVVGEASDGIEGLELAQTLVPDVAVFDVAMPRMGGLEATRLVHQSVPQVKIVILSMFSKESFALEALQRGAFAYILKGGPARDLLEAIRAAYEGRYYFSEDIHAEVIKSYVQRRQPGKRDATGYDLLTDREKQVFKLILEGYSITAIAEKLDIGHKTAEKHRTTLSKKLGMSNPVEMIKYAVKIGLIDPDAWRS